MLSSEETTALLTGMDVSTKPVPTEAARILSNLAKV